MRMRRSLAISPGMGFPRPASRLLAGGLLLLCLAVSGVLLPGGAALAAPASIGVGVQVGPVRLAAAAHPGGSYALPALLVINTGTQPESIRVRVQRLSAGPGLPVPRSWLRAPSPAARLDARESARVPLTLVVPAGARPGAYSSDVIAAGSAKLAAGPADLAAAAAAKLQFRVAAGPPPPGTGQASAPGGGGLPAAWKWALTAIVLLALAGFAARWSGIRIRIERAGPGEADEGARQ